MTKPHLGLYTSKVITPKGGKEPEVFLTSDARNLLKDLSGRLNESELLDESMADFLQSLYKQGASVGLICSTMLTLGQLAAQLDQKIGGGEGMRVVDKLEILLESGKALTIRESGVHKR